MHRHDFQGDDLTTILVANIADNFLQAFGYPTNQDLLPYEGVCKQNDSLTDKRHYRKID